MSMRDFFQRFVKGDKTMNAHVKTEPFVDGTAGAMSDLSRVTEMMAQPPEITPQSELERHYSRIGELERAIHTLQTEQAVTEANLQGELARMAQYVSQRDEEVRRLRRADDIARKRYDAELEADITARIEKNRSEKLQQIADKSRLAAASHAAIAELERDPDFDEVEEPKRETIVHRHTAINHP